jgi:L-aspartate oxidase
MSTVSHQVQDTLATDFLVIGSGLAGLLVALKLAEAGAHVTVASKGTLNDSNTFYAQGGLAASLPNNQFDSPQLHLEDTLRSGCGLVDPLVAQEIIFSGEHLVKELSRFGVHFDADDNGNPSLSFEGGHSRPRVVHNKDATGRSLSSSLVLALQDLKKVGRVAVLEGAFTQALLLKDGVCVGARLEINKRIISVEAGHTILATGGLGQLYARTTNPAIATGDGIALAYRAGAALIDMEFVQFHPTVLALQGAPAFLISEAARGAGAALQDGAGERFMASFHKDGELATRDVVARAIHSVMQSQHVRQVFLDLAPIGRKKLHLQFPNIVNTLRRFGIDVFAEPIPVSPAAHYFMGGIMADIDGNTTVVGLSAIGECASTGLHGANRLASNSLLEAGVMALRSADSLLKARPISRFAGGTPSQALAMAYEMPRELTSLKEMMYGEVGLIRSEESLKRMISFLSTSRSSSAPSKRFEFEAANLFLLAQLITNAALLRRESRGAHFRDDYQVTNEGLYSKRLLLYRSEYSWLPSVSTDVAGAKAPAKELLAVGNA